MPPKNTERPECLGAAENYCCKLSYSQILPHNSLLNWNCVALNPVRGSDPWVMFSLAGSGSLSPVIFAMREVFWKLKILSLRIWDNRHFRVLYHWSVKYTPDQTKGLISLVGTIQGGTEGLDVLIVSAFYLRDLVASSFIITGEPWESGSVIEEQISLRWEAMLGWDFTLEGNSQRWDGAHDKSAWWNKPALESIRWKRQRP